MVLYVSVVLMGAIAAIPAKDLDEDVEVAAVIWGSALGLALAHWFAFNASAHLFRGEGINREELAEGAWEAFAAVGVAVVATVPLLLLDTTTAAAISLIALAAVVTVVAYAASRHGGPQDLARLLTVRRAVGRARGRRGSGRLHGTRRRGGGIRWT